MEDVKGGWCVSTTEEGNSVMYKTREGHQEHCQRWWVACGVSRLVSHINMKRHCWSKPRQLAEKMPMPSAGREPSESKTSVNAHCRDSETLAKSVVSHETGNNAGGERHEDDLANE
jgi:hypothetical protein